MARKSQKYGIVSGWMEVPLEVCFRESTMEVLFRNGERRKLNVVTPFFRLPDGTEFSGRRVSSDLRARIAKASKPKAIVKGKIR